jgi:2-amino-4-hydroxy-6-hydroxymethyldihydropteridine diphosphokinase
LRVSDVSQPTLAIIALGSNLGDSAAIIEAAFERLQQISARPILRSSLWRSEPIDCPPGSPPFVNAAGVMTPRKGETPESLLAKLQAIETEFGRKPKVLMNEARPLDLDLIAFGSEQRATSKLTLPHPRAHLRRFVLAPLVQIAPLIKLPGSAMNFAELLSTCGDGTEVTEISSGE